MFYTVGANVKRLLFSKVLAAALVFLVLFVAPAAYLSLSNKPGNSVTVSVEIVGDDTDRFVPSDVVVTQGQVVTFAVFNSDDNTHGLAIPAFNMDTGIIKHGITVRFTFTADKAGTFLFDEPPGYCTGGNGNVCNSVQDLRGNLTVLP